MSVPYAEYSVSDLTIEIVAELVLTFEFIIISVFLWKRYHERKKSEIKDLFLVLILMAIGIGISTTPMILCIFDYNIPLNYGIPLFIGNAKLWYSNFTYLMMTVSSIFLLRFNQKLFQKPKDIVFKIYVALIVIFNIWSVWYGIFKYQPGKSSLTFIMQVYFLLLEFYAWIILLIYSIKAMMRVEKSVFRTGFKMIVISAGLILIGFVIWVVASLLKIYALSTSLWIFNCITGFLLYIGTILPPWFRKLVEKSPESISD